VIRIGMRAFHWAASVLGAAVLAIAVLALLPTVVTALELVETPIFVDRVVAGDLPPVTERVPTQPSLVNLLGEREAGQHGGNLRMLIGRPRDVRLLVVYGYARLVGYNERFEIVPDILQSIDVEDERIFTLHLREGHKWSDGAPFTSEDFRYWWKNVANNSSLSPSGPSVEMLVDGQLPVFEIIDELTVRYTWQAKNSFFLPRLAGASPLFIYRPAHYLRQFHADFADPEELEERIGNARSWASQHNRRDNMYRFDNPELPTLQPWINTTKPPANRFVAIRNPYFHRIDENGKQLPYIDSVIMNQSAAALIPAKAGAGDVDLQARGIFFNNYTFLRESEERSNYHTYLWREAKGSHLALFPNLNVNDAVWRTLMRDVRFRRALSLAIDRDMINDALYFGMALSGNNTVLPESPLFKEELLTKWAVFDTDEANRLLDEIGLTERKGRVRLLPDGREMNIIVETAGEDAEQVDALELIKDDWASIGVKMFIKPSQRNVLRNRVFSGATQISVWTGFENGMPTASFNPSEWAPTAQHSFQWPKWGQYNETKGLAGEPPDMPQAIALAELHKRWLASDSVDERRGIWGEMLAIHADQVFTIGVVSGVMQPVIVRKSLRNVPKEGVYNWDPGANFGIYRPDTFWFDTSR
jgi:peptide/nickel transport system substrate-binding protein